jgi:glutamyl-tRNA synthetase
MSFLVAWLSMRSRGGRVILRVEDIDGHGRDPSTVDGNCRDLRRLGLDWDEGYGVGGPHEPYRQSERTHLYRRALERLLAAGLVYPCVCSRSDARNAASAPHSGDYLTYDGRCRGRFASYADAERFLEGRRRPAWRFKVPDEEIPFHDGTYGDIVANPAKTYGDFPLARHPDGVGYQLAVVVDDIAMDVTEVVRGSDLLACVPWQILIHRALAPGRALPEFRHVPVLIDNDGKRLSKRCGSLTLASLFERGVGRERILGLLGFWCGWAEFGEELSIDELLRRYEPSTLQSMKPRLDAAALALLASHL